LSKGKTDTLHKNFIKIINTYKMKYFFSALIFCGGSLSVYAQTTLNLEQCVNYAFDHNLSHKQAQLTQKSSEIDVYRANNALLPTVNGQFQPSLNLGRSVDPTSNTFATQTIFSNAFSVSGAYTLYAGGQIKNNILQTNIVQRAAQADVANVKNTLALTIAQVYLQTLLAEDNSKTAQERLAQNQRQLANIQKFIDAGALPTGSRLDLEAQQASTEQQILQAQNAVEIAYLTLKMQMNYSENTDFKIEHTAINVPTENTLDALTPKSVYTIAENKQPQVIAADLRTKAAEVSIAMAKGLALPTVQAFTSVRTNYSNIAKRVKEGEYDLRTSNLGEISVDLRNTPLNAVISGPAAVKQPVPIFENNPYFNQIGENFSGAIGFSVNVPIYQANSTKVAVQSAKLAVERSKLAAEQTRQQLNNDITRALTDARTAQKMLTASEKALKALQASANNIEKRFAAGASTSFELTTSRSLVDNQQILVNNAKYDFIFKLKVLDFYQGVPIKL
jgi:outer membrane protein